MVRESTRGRTDSWLPKLFDMATGTEIRLGKETGVPVDVALLVRDGLLERVDEHRLARR